MTQTDFFDKVFAAKYKWNMESRKFFPKMFPYFHQIGLGISKAKMFWEWELEKCSMGMRKKYFEVFRIGVN